MPTYTSTLSDTTMNTPCVPYQAYKSKRHSRNGSNQSGTPPLSRPQSVVGYGATGLVNNEPTIHQRVNGLSASEQSSQAASLSSERTLLTRPVSLVVSAPHHETPSPFQPIDASDTPTVMPPSAPAPTSTHPVGTHAAPAPSSPVIPPTASQSSSPTTSPARSYAASTAASPTAGPSTVPVGDVYQRPMSTPRKTSTFRHVPLRPAKARNALPSSPLRLADPHPRIPSDSSSLSRQFDQPVELRSQSAGSSMSNSPTVPEYDRAFPPVPTSNLVQPMQTAHGSQPQASTTPSSPTFPQPTAAATSTASSPGPQIRGLSPAPIVSNSHSSPSAPSSSPFASSAPVRSSAPYRPGFQPRGLYRPRTDEFFDARKAHQDVGRIERTRLERRLEKLIDLHFAPEHKLREKTTLSPQRPQGANATKRLSSIFELDLSDLKNRSASELWRDVVQSRVTPNSKNDVRAAEQNITPWEDDSSVTQCPICSASFHPLTNRKHHCRLCGRVVCSLPVKYPQRPQACSLLFIADSKTGQIEEVGEGVDYGVRRRVPSNPQAKGSKSSLDEDEKFLKGVRICRDCRPVLLRQQYRQDVHRLPVFFKLYDAFIKLEREIEEALPQFQELMLSLSKQERPSPEASAARKRLLEAFGQYDVLAKRIRQLPCPGGSGSSQDRIQAAILNRASLFLQKHMFPLQSLPRPQKNTGSTPATAESSERGIDPDSQAASVLQPLLEQEALLETFVEEAKVHRKFEDAKTLKANLQEIRAEINRIITNSQTDFGGSAMTNGR